MAGSPRKPMPREVSVIPNWHADRYSLRSSSSCSAVRIALLGRSLSSSSSRLRRVRTSANSEATKNPLSRIRTRTARSSRTLTGAAPPGSGLRPRRYFEEGEPPPGGAPTGTGPAAEPLLRGGSASLTDAGQSTVAPGPSGDAAGAGGGGDGARAARAAPEGPAESRARRRSPSARRAGARADAEAVPGRRRAPRAPRHSARRPPRSSATD